MEFIVKYMYMYIVENTFIIITGYIISEYTKVKLVRKIIRINLTLEQLIDRYKVINTHAFPVDTDENRALYFATEGVVLNLQATPADMGID